MQINYARKFVKVFSKAPVKIQPAFYDRLEIFAVDKFNPALNNHKLAGKYNGYRSINISGDWRAIFREHENKNLAFFYLIGTHSELYK